MADMPYLAENQRKLKVCYIVDPRKDVYSAGLKKALRRNYWVVYEAVDYLCEISAEEQEALLLNGLNPFDYNESQLNARLRESKSEARDLWLDTDHKQEPREEFPTVHSLDDNPKLLAEYPVRYIIQWAISRDIKIHWLDWAIQEGLLSDLEESALSKDFPYAVNWDKWGKIRQIELSAACGLLAGIDVQEYLYAFSKKSEWFNSEYSTPEYENSLLERGRNDVRMVTGRLIAKADIDSVVRSHIASGAFIDVEKVKISQKVAEESTLHGIVPEGATHACHVYVDLPEFGTWALSVGYELPPEFPTVNHDKPRVNSQVAGAGPKSTSPNGASKGGKARAEIYKGAREVCRAEAKAMRAGKECGDKPNLDDCAKLIDGIRSSIEAERDITLPALRTIREYLKTKAGEAAI